MVSRHIAFQIGMDARISERSKASWRRFGEYKRYVTTQARQLRWEHAPQGPPYDPFEVAKALGVEVRLAALGNIDGYLESKDARWSAVISPSRSEWMRELVKDLRQVGGDLGNTRDM